MSMLDKWPALSADDSSSTRIRVTVLVLLCCQNAGHALLTRYSRGILQESYSSTEVVLSGEIFKLVVSGYLAITDRTDTDAQGIGFGKLLWLIRHSFKVIVLVILYALSNLLAYYALARVDASAYTVLLQLKILTTAGFSVMILDKTIRAAKWRALLLLVLGCVLVASPAYNQPVECIADTGGEFAEKAGAGSSSGEINSSSSIHVSTFQTILGFAAILAMNAISGFASIYFESMLKVGDKKITIWERNFQLAFCSIWLLAGVLSYEMHQGEQTELVFFKGWTINTVLIALIQAGGGLLVAACLKYADSILKTLATSGSIVLSAVLGYLFLGGQLDIFIGIGCVCTILAITNYTFE